MNPGSITEQPCICGSGRKLADCCLRKSTYKPGDPLPSGSFRFEPGSYGGSGAFMPSLAFLKEVQPGQWDYHFVLVRLDTELTGEDAACEQALKDLASTFVQGEKPDSLRMAERIKSLGYVLVEGFKVARAARPRSPTEY